MVTSNKESIPCNTFYLKCRYNLLMKYKLPKKLKINISHLKSLQSCRKNKKTYKKVHYNFNCCLNK